MHPDLPKHITDILTTPNSFEWAQGHQWFGPTPTTYWTREHIKTAAAKYPTQRSMYNSPDKGALVGAKVWGWHDLLPPEGTSMHAHPLYHTWYNMHNRCNDPRSPHWRRYGGRGITVCKRWSDFDTFVADMGPKPTPEHSIDRKDNDKGYSPGNCRWATRLEQARNTSTVKLTVEKVAAIKASTEPASVLAARYGCSRATVHSVRQGKSWEDVASAPRTFDDGRGF
jgi:hypothetical protein